jgi:hypothetical protein
MFSPLLTSLISDLFQNRIGRFSIPGVARGWKNSDNSHTIEWLKS